MLRSFDLENFTESSNKQPAKKITQSDAKFERAYLEYFILKKIYHCTPRELAQQSAKRVLVDLEIARWENKAEAIIAAKHNDEARREQRVSALKSQLK